VGSYFYLHFADEPDLAVARRGDDPGLDRRLWAGGSVGDWQTIRYELDDGIVTDYLANSDAFRLCSGKLRDVIDRNRGQLDSIQWLPAVVARPDVQEAPYWVLHFTDVADVLHKTRSLYSGDVLIKPCLATDLLAGRSVFNFERYGVRIVIAEAVKRAIEKAGCGGIKFSAVPVA
jgi:hypothetical protein